MEVGIVLFGAYCTEILAAARPVLANRVEKVKVFIDISASGIAFAIVTAAILYDFFGELEPLLSEERIS